MFNGQNIKIYRIKNLNTRSCMLLLKEKIEDSGFNIDSIKPGCIAVVQLTTREEQRLFALLKKYGLEVITNKNLELVEQIKQAIIELIHYMNNTNSVVRKSEYLVEKLGKSYSHLSRLFSTYEPITLEKYIILQKIERIKDLIDQDEYSLSEIGYMMDYNSVQYLSNQFHKVTGETVSEYKKAALKQKIFLDKIIENTMLSE